MSGRKSPSDYGNRGYKQTRCIYGTIYELQSIARATERADKKARAERESRKRKQKV